MKTTKITCPKCGTEITIPEHKTLAIDITISKDNGRNAITPPPTSDESNNIKTSKDMKAAQKIEALKKAGIDVSNLFAVANSESVARLDGGEITIISDNDPIFINIINSGTVPNRRLFRRWIMAQVFHMLTQRDWRTNKPIGFLAALQSKGYRYSWEMIIEEFRVQAKLSKTDQENFVQRNRWFNKSVAHLMANDYIKQLEKHIKDKKVKPKHCKGIPYISLGNKNIFIEDLGKAVLNPLRRCLCAIVNADTPDKLYLATKNFYVLAKKIYSPYNLIMSPAFKDAYKGAGAYFTIRNMILFHNAKFRNEKGQIITQNQSISLLESKAEEYKAEGWRLFGLMKEFIVDNGINIDSKIAEWRRNKSQRS